MINEVICSKPSFEAICDGVNPSAFFALMFMRVSLERISMISRSPNDAATCMTKN